MTTPKPHGPSQISQRDLRNRSAEIMDALERGESFEVTRNGHHIGDLVPSADADGRSPGLSSPPCPAACH